MDAHEPGTEHSARIARRKLGRRGLVWGGAALALGGAASMSIMRMGSPRDYARVTAAQRVPLDAGSGLREAIRYAALAANGHNTQPWRFHIIHDRTIQITPDFTRRTPVVDADDHHIFVSMGCAAENLSLACAALGLHGQPHFELEAERVVFAGVLGSPAASALYDAIPRRQSSRTVYSGRQASTSQLSQLARAAAMPGVDVVLVTDRAALARVRDVVVAANSVQMRDPAFVSELKQWLRFSPQAALQHADGLYSGSSGNPPVPDWLGSLLFELVFREQSENDKYARHLASSAGVAAFVGERADHASWVAVGRACQRFALQATALGMQLAFVNQPVEVAALRPELASLVGLPGRRPDLVLRFGYGPTLPASARRPLEAVIAG